MKEQEFLIPLNLPANSHAINGLFFNGSYCSVSAHMGLYFQAESCLDVAAMFKQVSVVLRLTSQSSALLKRMHRALGGACAIRTEAECFVNIAFTVNLRTEEFLSLDAVVIPQIDGALSEGDPLSIKKNLLDSMKELELTALQKSLAIYWQKNLLIQMQELFLPFEIVLKKDWPSQRAVLLEQWHGEFLAWESVVSHEIPMQCTVGGKNYRLTDFFFKSAPKGVTPCIISCEEPFSGQYNALAALVFDQTTHRFEDVERKDFSIDVCSLLDKIERQYPFPLKSALHLRWEFLQTLLAPNHLKPAFISTSKLTNLT